jgi:hypothetical protein
MPRLNFVSFVPKVRPEQFLGLEINHQAVAIAQLVLWIGYFQWQRKTTGKADTGDRPLLPKTHSPSASRTPCSPTTTPSRAATRTPARSSPSGTATPPNPTPSPARKSPTKAPARVLFDYANPRRAEWPQADFIVGNPPFIGASRMREALGDGYTEALRKAAWKGDVPESADFVMFWWHKAAELRRRKAKPNASASSPPTPSTRPSTAASSKPPLADPARPLHLAYAIPDHPWIDSADGAAVRIAMTVAAPE